MTGSRVDQSRQDAAQRPGEVLAGIFANFLQELLARRNVVFLKHHVETQTRPRQPISEDTGYLAKPKEGLEPSMPVMLRWILSVWLLEPSSADEPMRQGAETPRTSTSAPSGGALEFIFQHTATVSQSLLKAHGCAVPHKLVASLPHACLLSGFTAH